VFTKVATGMYPKPLGPQALSTPIYPHSSILSFSLLNPRLRKGLFLSGFPTKILYISHIFHACYQVRKSYSSWFDHSDNEAKSTCIMISSLQNLYVLLLLPFPWLQIFYSAPYLNPAKLTSAYILIQFS
jgi:hypothetical protein